LLQFTKVTTDVFAAVTYGRTMVLAGGGNTVETRTSNGVCRTKGRYWRPNV